MQTNHPTPDDPNARPLPQNYEAEQAVLGAILLEPGTMDYALTSIRANAFFFPQHRKIYSVMLDLANADKPVDMLLLVEQLNIKGWLEQVGSVSYLSQLATSVPTAANIDWYVKTVNEKYTQRLLILESQELEKSAYETEDAEQTISAMQTKLDNLTAGFSPRKSIRKIGDILRECFEDIENKYTQRDGTGVTGIPSGYDDLDRMTAGFQDGDLIIVGARPSMGKTAFALNISRNAAAESKKTIAVFSLEMSEKQLVNRMISAEANIDGNHIRSGHLVGDDWDKLAMAIGILDQFPILIDDTPGITTHEIRAKCRKLKKDNNLGMIVIDYLQLIEAITRTGINRQQEITEISRTLKKIARELEVPVIALSQLSRGVEQRQDKRPMMSDLRESGSIEQDADIVAFLYRDDYYNKESDREGVVEVIIAKQRNGPIGIVELAFLKNYNKFASLERDYFKKNPPKETTYKKPDMWKNPR